MFKYHDYPYEDKQQTRQKENDHKIKIWRCSLRKKPPGFDHNKFINVRYFSYNKHHVFIQSNVLL